ncbi:NAD-dependent epimerase/dehydratase family protein [Kordiimonas marina]|uniref:NAD-dependent epimerase/dehydratase family protein n=1 Tax=Kordiimonas marina TaxID=2872312 RepID=UPI001FF64801|nr:NAD-dependent epimerase/dehydratase family protein [Kordiimonas marina]MCJ9427571.1 NAD-dependent epimerase/dehydratase family protein [Kordiimonas marina]
MAILITGAAGFIGFHVSKALLARGHEVVGIDNLNDYYSPALKKARLDAIEPESGFHFHQLDFANAKALDEALAGHTITQVIHLGAQAGVRYSIDNPMAYIQSNLVGHANILEYCRHSDTVDHLLYASSSSVYGGNTKLPFALDDRTDTPVSLYAATKRADELLSQSYAHLYRLPQTGFRFFTVYGPWGRPDMAIWLFTDAILNGRPIKVFNHGDMARDFTYIGDVVAGIVAALNKPPRDDGRLHTFGSTAPHTVYNIGNNEPEQLLDMIGILEGALGQEAVKEFLPMQPGDVKATYADITAIQKDLGFKPSTPLQVGLPRFVDWFRQYHGL